MDLDGGEKYGNTSFERMNRAFNVAEVVLREIQELPDVNLKEDLEWVQELLDGVLMMRRLPLVDLAFSEEDDYIDMASSTRVLA